MKNSLFLVVLTFATVTLNTSAQTAPLPATLSPLPAPQATTPAATTNTNEVTELKTQVADLSKQVGELSKLLGEYAKANAALAAALTNPPPAAPPKQPQQAPQAAMPLQWRRTANGGWFLSAGGDFQQTLPTGQSIDLNAVVRGAPGRVVGVSVASEPLGPPYNAHIAGGSVFYSLAPGGF